MKSIVRNQLDEKGEEIADVLTSLGISRPIAKTLSYLKDLREATSEDLERSQEKADRIRYTRSKRTLKR